MSNIQELGHNAQKALIGQIITRGLSGFHAAAETLSEADFSNLEALALWKVLARIEKDGKAICIPGVLSAIKAYGMKGDFANPAIFVDNCCELGINLEQHIAEVTDYSQRANMIHAGDALKAGALNTAVPVDETIAQMEASLQSRKAGGVASVDSKSAMRLMRDDLDRRVSNRGKIQGIPTGFPTLDRMTSGLQFRELAILGARPSIGKSAIALNIVRHACIKHGIPTLFVSLEMSKESLLRRLVADHTEIPISNLRDGELDDQDISRIGKAEAAIGKAPLRFLEVLHGIDSRRLCSAIRGEVRRHNIQLVVLDYMQKVKGASRHEKRTYEIAEVSGDLKSCAQRTNTAFLVLAQMNRGSEIRGDDSGPAQPRLAELGESGRIEQDADLVALLHRNRMNDQEQPMLIVAKQRDGETGPVYLNFDGRFCRFTEQPYRLEVAS